jgi:predicted amidohydrolase
MHLDRTKFKVGSIADTLFEKVNIIRKTIKGHGPYSHLEGNWHQYHITKDRAINDPFWAHNEEFIRIKHNRIEGRCINAPNPKADLTYTISGQIEAGKMLLVYACHQEPRDCLHAMYLNLLSDKILAGIWLGVDFDMEPFSGPIILSREELTVEDLNRIVSEYNLNLVGKAYKLLTKIEEQEIRGKKEEVKKRVKVEQKYIGKVELEWVKVALVQLDYSAKRQLDPTFAYILESDKRNETKKKIDKALERAVEEKVNVICFPEFSFLEEWVPEIKNKYREMVVICGSYYKDRFNICPIIIDGECFDYKKVCPAPLERPGKTEPEHGMKSGDVIFRFETRYGIFSVLICNDCRELIYKVGNVDYIINPSYDPHISNVQEVLNSEARDHHITTIQANAMEQQVTKDGKILKVYGKSCIISNEWPSSIEALKNDGYKPKEDNIPYKICEAMGEMMIIANINIKIKYPPSPTPPDYEGRIRGIRRYIWQKGEWQKQRTNSMKASQTKP